MLPFQVEGDRDEWVPAGSISSSVRKIRSMPTQLSTAK